MEFQDWMQQVAGSVIETKMQAQYVQPFEIEKMKLQAYGPYGQPYLEGIANSAPGQVLAAQIVPGVPNWVLIGGAVLAVVLLGD